MIDDMDKIEEKGMTKKRPFAKVTWYDWYNWLINLSLKSIKNGGWC